MSTPVVAVCPHCDKKLKVKKPELIGKKVKCPGCSQPFRLQAQQQEETYSLSQPKKEPKAASAADDDWFSALGEAAQSEQSQAPAHASSTLPPRVDKPKKKKKKPREFGPEPVPGSEYDDDRYGYGVEAGMGGGMIGAMIGGGIAGVIGALVWGGIIYGTGYEVGYVAWGIGALVGFGVLLGSQEYSGVTSGIVALVLANLSIFFGKCFGISLLVSDMFGINPLFSPITLISATFQTLEPIDGLWILLASFTAYRIGANEHEDE
jgi:hypothetical protein